ncbi:MAG: glycogen debranching protein GlgX, partial [Terriglobales bacterium]
QDLVSYNQKHNEANGEDNRDGNDDNRSWNCGAEGPTDDPEINQLRARQKRNIIATLLLSQGVPMLLAGDEIGHTQQGNNNAYCQDNEISWISWDPVQMDTEFLGFVKRLIALRHDHPAFHRRNFFQGRKIKGAEVTDIAWLRPDGQPMTDEEWNQEFARCLGVSLSGEAVDEVDERGQRVRDENFLMLLNAHHEEIPFALPPAAADAGWIALVDTSCQTTRRPDAFYNGGSSYPLQARSLALLVERSLSQIRAEDRRYSFSA